MKEDLSREEAAMVELRGGRCGGGGLRELDLLAFVFFLSYNKPLEMAMSRNVLSQRPLDKNAFSLRSIYTMNA